MKSWPKLIFAHFQGMYIIDDIIMQWLTPRNIDLIVYFQMSFLPLNLDKIWARYKLFWNFPTHLLHFSQRGKIIEKCEDQIWDWTDWGYLRGFVVTSKKIKILSHFLYYVICGRSLNLDIVNITWEKNQKISWFFRCCLVIFGQDLKELLEKQILHHRLSFFVLWFTSSDQEGQTYENLSRCKK
jgi:hypothetical protein